MQTQPNDRPGNARAEQATDHVANICMIAQGLLASGHFTKITRQGTCEEPWAKSGDSFDAWIKGDVLRCVQYYAAAQAIGIYEQILFDWEREGR